MKLAVVDIGSNAARLLVSRVIEYKHEVTFKKLDYIRYPIRLGQDVFAHGYIQRRTEEKFLQLMQVYRNMLDLHEIDHYLACATSAMREAENGEHIARRIYYNHGLRLTIIDGNKEAEFIAYGLNEFINGRPSLHIDVGGGSTELNLYRDHEKVASRSFKMGSVRHLNAKQSDVTWAKLQFWIEEHTAYIDEPIVAIGTGGNINKLCELSAPKNGKGVTVKELKRLRDEIDGLSMEERLNGLRLNPDRADIIVPAADIYIRAMEMAGAEEMLVPQVSLKEGMLHYLYQKAKKEANPEQ